MPTINLLPWREELRTRRNQEFGVLTAVAAGLMAVIVLAVQLQFDAWIEYQESRNEYLKAEIRELDKKIKEIKNLEKEKARLLARMKIIQQLQTSRPDIVHLFDEMVTSLPEGVYYKSVEQRGKNLTLKGTAQSNARVSSLMRELDKSGYLTDPRLVRIQAEKQQGARPVRLSAFDLRVKQTRPKKEGEGAEEEENP